ncbi:MAG: prepilin-type N-terminal cleavage/methylation domain-containing protein [Pseudomonadota bacterium]
MSVRRYTATSEQGLTLLEVLVTLGIIAAVAGIGVQVFTTVGTDASDRLVRLEMRQIANAIQRFRQDTGYWPKQGPFATVDDTNLSEPANLQQLFNQPQNSSADVLPYDLASGTGWNGPYISELDALAVAVGDNLAADGTGVPTSGATVTLRAIGDPFNSSPVGAFFVWQDSTGTAIAELGRPFYYFIDGANVAGCTAPCLLSSGPDGEYDQGGDDDIVVNIGALN